MTVHHRLPPDLTGNARTLRFRLSLTSSCPTQEHFRFCPDTMMSRLSSSFTKDDIHAAFHISCCLFGIGALGMPFDYAKSGPFYGTFALLSMCAFNIYATILLSICYRCAPRNVVTLSELGQHALGTPGRIAVEVTQMGTCLLLPVAFFILGGGTLLPRVFHNVLNLENVDLWIVVLALSLWPVALIRTLKEAKWVMLLGTATTFGCIVLVLADSAWTNSWTQFEPTQVELGNVLPVFGSMELAYGAAVIIPSVQREHPEPARMPRVIGLSLGLITMMYFIIGGFGYAQFGCAAPENLLLMMEIGRKTSRVACALMQIHIMIATVLLLQPAFFYFERKWIIGSSQEPTECPKKHRHSKDDNIDIEIMEHPTTTTGPTTYLSAATLEKFESEENNNENNDTKEAQVPFTKVERIKSYVLRTVILATQVGLALGGKESFNDVLGLIGATTIGGCCIILPCLLYLAMFNSSMSRLHVILCWTVIVVSTLLGLYTTYIRFQKIVQTHHPKDDDQLDYPFCPASFHGTTSV